MPSDDSTVSLGFWPVLRTNPIRERSRCSRGLGGDVILDVCVDLILIIFTLAMGHIAIQHNRGTNGKSQKDDQRIRIPNVSGHEER
jgi:hypothetical protein